MKSETANTIALKQIPYFRVRKVAIRELRSPWARLSAMQKPAMGTSVKRLSVGIHLLKSKRVFFLCVGVYALVLFMILYANHSPLTLFFFVYGLMPLLLLIFSLSFFFGKSGSLIRKMSFTLLVCSIIIFCVASPFRRELLGW